MNVVVFLALLVKVAADREFMRVAYYSPFTYATPYAGQLGFDLLVNQAILITALGVADFDNPGIIGTLDVVLLDRVTQAVVVGPVTFNASDARNVSNDPNLTVWRTIEPVRVEAGTYLLTTNWTTLNNFLSNVYAGKGHTVTPGDLDGLVTPLAGIVAGLYSLPGIYQCGPNMRFRAADPLPLSAADLQGDVFADCEDVACRSPGQSGAFNIRGRYLFCDNESQGGGWTRLWSARDSSCEAQGWTSTRIPTLQEAPGCRSDVLPCKATDTALASTPFRAVLVRDFELWTIGGTGATIASSTAFDGVAVHADATLVWAFLASSNATVTSQCPCVTNTSESASKKLGGAFWSCDTGQRSTATWQPLFGASASVCSGTNESVRVLPEARVSLKVSICQDAAGPAEGVKLSKGEIFVRKTPDFDRRRSCPALGTLPPAPSQTLLHLASTSGASTASTVSQLQPTSAAAGAASDVAWIVPTVIAVVLFLVVVVLAALLLRRSPASPSAAAEMRTARDVGVEDNDRYGSVADVRVQPVEASGAYNSTFGSLQ